MVSMVKIMHTALGTDIMYLLTTCSWLIICKLDPKKLQDRPRPTCQTSSRPTTRIHGNYASYFAFCFNPHNIFIHYNVMYVDNLDF